MTWEQSDNGVMTEADIRLLTLPRRCLGNCRVFAEPAILSS